MFVEYLCVVSCFVSRIRSCSRPKIANGTKERTLNISERQNIEKSMVLFQGVFNYKKKEAKACGLNHLFCHRQHCGKHITPESARILLPFCFSSLVQKHRSLCCNLKDVEILGALQIVQQQYMYRLRCAQTTCSEVRESICARGGNFR